MEIILIWQPIGRKRSESESLGEARQAHQRGQYQNQLLRRCGSGRIRHASGEPVNYPRKNRTRSQSFTDDSTETITSATDTTKQNKKHASSTPAASINAVGRTQNEWKMARNYFKNVTALSILLRSSTPFTRI